MPNSKIIGTYPTFFWDIEGQILREYVNSPSIPVQLPSRQAAIRLRLQFYSWRKLRMAEGASDSLKTIVVRLQEPSTLVFEANQQMPEVTAQLRQMGIQPYVDEASKASLKLAMERLMSLQDSITPAAEGGREGPTESQDDILRKLGYIK